MLIISAFLVLALGLFAFLYGLEERSAQGRAIRERLLGLESAASREDAPEAAILRDELLSTIPALNRLLSQSPAMRRLQRYIYQADLSILPGKLLLIAACCGAFPALVVNLYWPGLIPLFVLLIGCAAPFGVLAVRRGRRFRAFEQLFPEAIDLLARAVRAGHSFSSSLEVIANELGDPVASEFRQVYEQQKYGLAARDALLNLVDRVPLVDVRFFVAAVVLQRESGGNLGELLDKLSYIIRERFKILRQVRVYTAQGRLSMVILMAFPFALAGALSVVTPGYLRPLLTDPLGHTFIAIGLIMMTLGFFVLQKIIHIKV
jgi:tight adherence protein B